MNNLFAAIRFLTIFPVPGDASNDGVALQKSLVYFPIVGLLLGSLAALFTVALGSFFPPPVFAAMLVLLLVAFSGGLHMDGLADTADGFFSSRPRERILEIMRDSCIGSMGTLAIVLILLLKVTALANISGAKLWEVVFLMPLAGRCTLTFMTVLFPYARPKGGIASPFLKGGKVLPVAVAFIVLSVTTYMVAGNMGIACLLATCAFCALFGFYCQKKIGGVTGDTFGASCELVETVIALIFTL